MEDSGELSLPEVKVNYNGSSELQYDPAAKFRLTFTYRSLPVPAHIWVQLTSRSWDMTITKQLSSLSPVSKFVNKLTHYNTNPTKSHFFIGLRQNLNCLLGVLVALLSLIESQAGSLFVWGGLAGVLKALSPPEVKTTCRKKHHTLAHMAVSCT